MAGVEEKPYWMTPYMNFLIRGVLPSNENKARRLKQKASNYVIIDGELFKRGLTTPLLKFPNNQQANCIMRELHEGISDLHTEGWSLATKVVCAGYYWPTLRACTLDFTKRCRSISPNNLHSLISHWPFVMCGMEILRPLPKAPEALFTPDNNQWNSLLTHILHRCYDYCWSRGTINKEIVVPKTKKWRKHEGRARATNKFQEMASIKGEATKLWAVKRYNTKVQS